MKTRFRIEESKLYLDSPSQEEILELDNHQLLQIAVDKWAFIVEALETYPGTGFILDSRGAMTCSLCIKYNTGKNYCVGCPIREKTGLSSCEDTPYTEHDFDSYFVRSAEDARDELRFLEELLEERQTKRGLRLIVRDANGIPVEFLDYQYEEDPDLRVLAGISAEMRWVRDNFSFEWIEVFNPKVRKLADLPRLVDGIEDYPRHDLESWLGYIVNKRSDHTVYVQDVIELGIKLGRRFHLGSITVTYPFTLDNFWQAIDKLRMLSVL